MGSKISINQKKRENMKQYFIIPIYHPDINILNNLLKVLSEYNVLLINNDPIVKFKMVAENITVINNKINYGFGGGVNIGMRFAFESGATWSTILNQDLILSKLAIHNINKKLLKLPPSIVGPFSGILDKKRWSTIIDEQNYKLQNNPDYISGSFLSIHKDVVKTIGYFYEPYFMYYEDVDYSVRAYKAGFSLITTSGIGIIHKHDAVVGVGSKLHQYYLSRNHLLFVKRNAPINVKLHEFLRMPKTLYEHYKRKEYGAIIGIKDYIFCRFKSK